MDKETGEALPEPETGEITSSPITRYDRETGELESNYTFTNHTRSSFKVPRYCINPHKEKRFKPSEKRLELITAVIFLIPSFVFFYPLLGIIICVFEIVLHRWCHMKNKKVKDDSKYYQSPLHVICKEFCGDCKAEVANKKINKIHDIRNDRVRRYGLESIRRVA